MWFCFKLEAKECHPAEVAVLHIQTQKEMRNRRLMPTGIPVRRKMTNLKDGTMKNKTKKKKEQIQYQRPALRITTNRFIQRKQPKCIFGPSNEEY